MNDKSHAATPITAAPSEPKPELSAGVPSSVICHCTLAGQVLEVTVGTCCEVCDAFPETVGERLKHFYPEHYVTIITRMNEQNGSEHTARMLSDKAVGNELNYVFLWARTIEGHGFWANLAKREGS